MDLNSIKNVELSGKTTLVRVDYNVSVKEGIISDDSRLRATLSTISYLRENGAKIVLCSHLGRPDGKVVEELRLTPVGNRLSILLNQPVQCLPDAIGGDVRDKIHSLKPGDILLLENLRFYPGEEKNDGEFCKLLAEPFNLFVNDAFGTAHRAHASTYGVTALLPSYAGFLLEREVEMLSQVIQDPKRPLAAVMGGAKIGDKIPLIQNLLSKVDTFIIGGGMAATFYFAQGLSVGGSLIEENYLDLVKEILLEGKEKGVKFCFPSDVVIAKNPKAGVEIKICQANEVPHEWNIFDIGPQTIGEFGSALRGIKTVLWNGPMGIFEIPEFSKGTNELAKIIGSLPGATTIVGGGSTVEAITSIGLEEEFTHVSTGGGASLEFLEGQILPGIKPLYK